MSNHLYCTWAHRGALPADLRSRFRDLDEFVRTLTASASSRLLIVSPYLSPGGMTSLQKPIAVSAQRGAWIRIVTGDVQDPNSYNSRSILALLEGPEGELIRTRLRVLSVSASLTEMVHAKCIVADGKRGYLGSANLSVSGLEKNFELGVNLDEADAFTLDQLVAHFESNGGLEDHTQLFRSR